MKQLYLLRHAKSAEKVTGQSDKQRTLAPKGIQQCATVGAYIIRNSYHIEHIICSSSTRTVSTAELVAEQIKKDTSSIITEDDLYEASTGTILRTIQQQDEHSSLMIVGHNPAISYLAEFIANDSLEEMHTGTLIIFKCDIRQWKELNKGMGKVIDRFDP